jgi:putative heme-binding domain-containing protein
MQMLRPDYPGLRVPVLKQFLESKDRSLRREAARTLAMRSDPASQALLRQVAVNQQAEHELRAEAVMGLAHSAAVSFDTRRVLIGLLRNSDLDRDALRSLRETAKQPEVAFAVKIWWDNSANPPPGHVVERQEAYEQLAFTLRPDKNSEEAAKLQKLLQPRPKNEKEWLAALESSADAAGGERVFFHPRGPRCHVCHRVDGRGGVIGPDLSKIARSLSREKLIESILNPSKEIAPQFVAWHVVTRDGKVHTGVIVEEAWNSMVTMADAQGNLETFHRTTIEERHALPTSIMPANLPELMTRQEFRDLLAFLSERK